MHHSQLWDSKVNSITHANRKGLWVRFKSVWKITEEIQFVRFFGTDLMLRGLSCRGISQIVCMWFKDHFDLCAHPRKQGYLNTPTLIDSATSGFLVLAGPDFFRTSSGPAPSSLITKQKKRENFTKGSTYFPFLQNLWNRRNPTLSCAVLPAPWASAGPAHPPGCRSLYWCQWKGSVKTKHSQWSTENSKGQSLEHEHASFFSITLTPIVSPSLRWNGAPNSDSAFFFFFLLETCWLWK